jgi:enoyl-[acyl-carrier protein] reductase I
VELKAATLSRAPLRRTASALEVGATAVFLASDGAASVTGQVWNLDGGYSAVM